MVSFSDLLWHDGCQNRVTTKSNQKNWTDVRFKDYPTAYWNWTGTKEVYNSPCELPNYYHLRKLFSPKIYIPSDIVCGNEDFII